MFDIYLAHIQNGILHRRAAVQIELGVGLCIAHDFAADAVEGRAMLVNVYASAGYDCLSPDGRDYKTINRRVNTSFLLYDTIGHDVVAAAIAEHTGHKRIEGAQMLVYTRELYTYDDVLAHCGRPRQMPVRQSTPTFDRRAADIPGAKHVKTAHIDVMVPPTASRAEVMDLVVKLVALAETLNGKRAKSS